MGEMERLSINNEHIQPVTIDYNRVINAYANGGHMDAAEKLFQRMIIASKRDKRGIKPDKITCTTILKACVNSNDSNSVKKGQAFFNAMLQMYKNGAIEKIADEDLIPAKHLMNKLRQKHLSKDKHAASRSI